MLTDANDIQADFLNALMRERKVVWVFLVNGIKLTGQLISFDKYVLALESPTGIQTVYKSAVSTVCESHFVEKPRTRDRPATPHERQPARGHER
ncbi:Hfq protein [Caballeronia glebae]|uniref:Hfq protein n=1 Tax=Caballeronia glebae TaxID=1777143 RepID=A0A158BK60_9BURK|nr:RNA chaperone Hfq [Caballeronia glebae]SAK70136.1 Hfq protein [Caballeronia glebae]